MISRDCLHPIFSLKLSTGTQVSILEIFSWYGLKKKQTKEFDILDFVNIEL